MVVLVQKVGKNSIEDLGSPDKFLQDNAYLFGESASFVGECQPAQPGRRVVHPGHDRQAHAGAAAWRLPGVRAPAGESAAAVAAATPERSTFQALRLVVAVCGS